MKNNMYESHNRHVCCVTQQTCLLVCCVRNSKSDMSAV